jgi:hypothetical protein
VERTHANGEGNLGDRVALLERLSEDQQVQHERLLTLANANARRLQALEQHTGLVPEHRRVTGLRSIPPMAAKYRGSLGILLASVLSLALQYLAAQQHTWPRWEAPASEVERER